MRTPDASAAPMPSAMRDPRVLGRAQPIAATAHPFRRTLILTFHWVTVVLVVAVFTLGWAREAIDDLALRAVWLNVHRSVGLLILAMTLVRLASRLILGPATHHPDLPLLLWLASRANHLLLYLLLVAMPLLGWAQSSARVRRLDIFGVRLPPLTQYDRDMADVLRAWHDALAWVLLALILIHALAALYHHHVRRDDVLRAMLPGRGSGQDE